MLQECFSLNQKVACFFMTANKIRNFLLDIHGLHVGINMDTLGDLETVNSCASQLQ